MNDNDRRDLESLETTLAKIALPVNAMVRQNLMYECGRAAESARARRVGKRRSLATGAMLLLATTCGVVAGRWSDSFGTEQGAVLAVDRPQPGEAGPVEARTKKMAPVVVSKVARNPIRAGSVLYASIPNARLPEFLDRDPPASGAEAPVESTPLSANAKWFVFP